MSGEQSTPAAEGGEAVDASRRIEIIGEATPEQVAALMAVISGLGGGDEEPAPAPSRWVDRSRLVRESVRPGPGAWRASALPR